jgi:hypothetical protein
MQITDSTSGNEATRPQLSRADLLGQTIPAHEASKAAEGLSSWVEREDQKMGRGLPETGDVASASFLAWFRQARREQNEARTERLRRRALEALETSCLQRKLETERQELNKRYRAAVEERRRLRQLKTKGRRLYARTPAATEACRHAAAQELELDASDHDVAELRRVLDRLFYWHMSLYSKVQHAYRRHIFLRCLHEIRARRKRGISWLESLRLARMRRRLLRSWKEIWKVHHGHLRWLIDQCPPDVPTEASMAYECGIVRTAQEEALKTFDALGQHPALRV